MIRYCTDGYSGGSHSLFFFNSVSIRLDSNVYFAKQTVHYNEHTSLKVVSSCITFNTKEYSVIFSIDDII